MFWYKDFLIITLIILLIVHILGKSKHLIENIFTQFRVAQSIGEISRNVWINWILL